jgi:ubiquinone/menaquinone biosynthesis C-methylase UbiE
MGEILRPGGIGLTAHLAEIAGVQKHHSILDIGCGKGTTVAYLAREYDVRIVGIDLSDEMISYCRSNIGEGKAPKSICFLIGDGEELPFCNSSFDIVITESAFSLSPDMELAAKEIGRVLKPGGRMIMSDFIIRGTIDKKMQKQINFPCCLSNALRLDEYIQLFELAGLKSHYIEDRTDELRKAGYQFYMYLNSMEDLAELKPAGPCKKKGRDDSAISFERLQEFFQSSKPGYVLIVMTKSY